MHKLFARSCAQYAAIAPHRFRYQKSPCLYPRRVQRRGVKLHELHVFYSTLSPVYHCDTITGGDDRVGRIEVYLPRPAGSEHGSPSDDGLHRLRLLVEGVGTIAPYVGRDAGDRVAEVVLRDEVYRVVMLV